MAIREELDAVMTGVASARSEPLKDHPFAHRIAHDWPAPVAAFVDDSSYKVEGSPGKGVWADAVWLAVFDRMITETAQRGFYVVYLVPADGSRAYLSLNQGTTEIHDRVGPRYREVLKQTASRDVGLLEREDTEGLIVGPIDLDGTTMLSRGYESGNILATEYALGTLPSEDELENDLTRLLLLYQSLIEARDQVEADETETDDPNQPPRRGLEAKRYRWHWRAERTRSLAKAAKRIHGTKCQVEACGKELAEIYGDIAGDYIEAHHLTLFAGLDGRPTELDPETDFAVVCPDCHRMLHRRRNEPYSLAELSAMIDAST